MGEIFTAVLVNPILTALVAFYTAFSFLHIPYALGFSIILLTALFRLALFPLMASQLKMSKKMQQLTPHLTTLKEKHKNDRMKLQQAQAQLYKEHGINPVAGCIPTLIQFPLLIALYQALERAIALNPNQIVASVNKSLLIPSLQLTKPWDTTFFGIPLAKSPAELLPTMGVLVMLVPIITALLQYVQSKMIMAPKQPKDKKSKEKKSTEEDFAQAFQTQSTYIFPLMIGFFSYSFPFGLSLYWNTFSLFGILQQYQIYGWGGLTSLIPQKKTS